MTDEQKKGYDPADQSPAEGQSRPIAPKAQGEGPKVDPAAKDAPAEGGRDEVEGQAERA